MKIYISTLDAMARVVDHPVRGVSCVRPNEALSIREVFDRFVRQQPIPHSTEGVYSSDTTLDNMDKLGRAELNKRLKANIKQANDKLKADNAAAAEAKRQSDLSAARKAAIDEFKAQSQSPKGQNENA